VLTVRCMLQLATCSVRTTRRYDFAINRALLGEADVVLFFMEYLDPADLPLQSWGGGGGGAPRPAPPPPPPPPPPRPPYTRARAHAHAHAHPPPSRPFPFPFSFPIARAGK
jgi:hypothetical protein